MAGVAYCTFTATPCPGGFRQDCKGGVSRVVPSQRYVRICTCDHGVALGTCAHLGSVIGLEGCESCRGRVNLKVFACAVRGKCTLQTRLGDLPCCHGCPDAVKPPAEPSAHAQA